MKIIKINNFKEKIYYEKLSNGLEIYLFPTPKQKNYCAYFTTKFGGATDRYKKEGKEYNIIPGTAHFLEHKLFEQENGENALTFYAKSGSNVNAWTSKKFTTYYFEGCENFEDNLKYLINYVSNPYITDENVKKEKGIIKQEIRRYKDEPDSILFERLYNNLFHVDGIKRDVAGEEKDIDKITKESLMECYNTFYQPSNMFLIISGNFKPKNVLELVKKEIKDKEKIPFEIIKEEEPDTVLEEKEYLKMDIKSDKLAFAYKMNKNLFGDNLYSAKYYFDIILESNFGVGSEFRERMRINKLFTGFTTYHVESSNHLIIMFLVETTKTKRMINEIKREMKKLKVTKEEFERSKKIYISYEIRKVEDQEMIIDSILSDIISDGKYHNQRIEDINNLEYSSLLKLMKNLDFSNNSFVVISNKEKSNNFIE